jgi:Polyketide cyclase / dehydrase and lipid transport
MRAPCPPGALFREVEDLARYPGWLTIVTRAEPAPDEDQETRPAWFVELRGRIGPLARSKRLRMVRTVHEPGRRVRFERREVDGREHSAWVLDARVEPAGSDESSLEMSLHYGGSFGGAILERLLADEIEASRPRLADRVRGRTHPGFGVTDHR